eukprot:TCONS_00051066-protein
MIMGSDFVIDLLAIIVIMKPLRTLILLVQSLDCPVWKLKKLYQTVKKHLQQASSKYDKTTYPTLFKHKNSLEPGKTLQDVTLMEGWLVNTSQGRSGVKWYIRNKTEIKRDHLRFAKDLMESLEKMITPVLNQDHIKALEVFDMGELVKLNCGTRIGDRIQFTRDEGEYEEYGVIQCKKFMSSVCKMPSLEEFGINLDPRLSSKYMRQLKDAVRLAVWDGLVPMFGVSVKDVESISKIEDELSFDLQFNLTFKNGEEKEVKLNEQLVYESFYNNESLYKVAEKPVCAMIDIALAKGGPESIAESYYACMRGQQQAGGQSNDTLSLRTKLSWCLPSFENCQNGGLQRPPVPPEQKTPTAFYTPRRQQLYTLAIPLKFSQNTFCVKFRRFHTGWYLRCVTAKGLFLF